ncbi:MAG: AsmA-like C-terminal domain-containing protein [Desulfomonile tiedjei]|nr:AsmA-like C-terminal domain-containing protein [Desulfomonile tiedjei]
MDHDKTNKQSRRSSVPRVIAACLLLIFLCILVIGMAAVLYARYHLDGEQIARFVIPRLENEVEKRISFSSVDLTWLSFDTPRIILTGLKVREKADEKVVIDVPEIMLEMRLLPILKGTIAIERVRIVGPTVSLGPEQLQPEKEPQAGPRSWIPPAMLWPVVKRFELSDGRMVWRGTAGRLDDEGVLLSNIEITATDLTPRGAGGFVIKGLAPEGNRTGSFHVSGELSEMPWQETDWRGKVRVQLTDFPLLPFQALVPRVKKELPAVAGTVNLDVTAKGEPKNCNVAGILEASNVGLAAGPIFFRQAQMDKARVRFKVERSGESIQADLPEVSLPGLALAAEAKLGNISSPDATLTLALKKADLELGKLFPFIPLNLFNIGDRDRLLEAGLKGHIIVTGGSWTGRLSDFLHKWNQGAILLDVLLDKISGFVPGLGLPVAGASGHVRLSSDEILFNGISLTVGSSPIVLNGWIQDLNKSPRSDLFLSMTAQAQDLKPILENTVIARHAGQWLQWIKDPIGGIAITLDIKGSLDRPSMKGRVMLEDLQCNVSGLPFPVKKVNGALRFRGSSVSFSGLKGLIGESQAELTGTASPEHTEITGEIKVVPHDLKAWLPSGWAIGGNVPLSLSVKGKAPRMDFSVGADLKANSLRVGSFLKKKPGAPLKIEASGSRGPDGLTIEDAYLVANQSRISSKITVNGNRRATILVNLPPKGIQTDELVSIVDPDLELQPGGRLEGDAVIRTSLDRFQDLSLEANLLLNHVSLRLPGFHKRAEGLTGSIHRRPKSMNITLERAKIGSSLIQGTMSILDFENPKVDINLESSFLDTTDFTAPRGYIPKMTWGEWIRVNPVFRFLARSRGAGLVKIAKGKTEVRTFSNFQAQFEGANGLIKSPKWQMNYADGTITGSALFDIRMNTQTPLTLDFQADHLKMDRVMLSDPNRLKVEGDTLVEGRMKWNLGDTGPKNNGLYKTGTMEVRLRDGAVHRFETLSKIFSLVNLGSLLRGRLPDVLSQGLPYQHFTWKMEVFDSKWKIKDLKLEADAARINSTGMYFGDQDRVDFKVDVSPLVGLDTLVSGLFGNLITKDGKILTTTFRVRGPSASPDVRLEFENLKQPD